MPPIHNSLIKQWAIRGLVFAVLVAVIALAARMAFRNNTPGIDYYVYWTAGRAFVNHQDPYSADVDRQIQIGVHGHPATGDENRMEYANPAYALFLILPFIGLDFNWSQAIWISINFLLTFSIAYSLFPSAPRWVRLTFPFFYPFVFGYSMGNYAVIVAGVLLVFLKWFVCPERPSRWNEIATGLIMAWATIKPQFSWMFIVVFFAYGFRQRLWAMLASFGGGVLVVSLAAMVVRPDWIVKWVEELSIYRAYNNALPYLENYLARFLPGSFVQPAFVLVLLICGIVSLYLLYRWWNHQLEPVLVVAWTSFFTYLIHPSGGAGVAYEQLVFLIPFFLWAVLEKPSPTKTLIWIAGGLLSFIKTPAWFEQCYFLLFGIWMVWLYLRKIRLPSVRLATS